MINSIILILKEKTKTGIIIDDSVEQNPDIYSIINWVVDEENNMKLPFKLDFIKNHYII